MRRFIRWVREALFGDSLDFRAHIFNALGLLGFVLSFSLGVYYIVNYSSIGNILGNFASAATAVAFLILANRTKAFKLLSLLTVVLVFIIIFPILFFSGGGYHSGMTSFFLFAFIFTLLMLEGWPCAILTSIEFIVYLGCFLTAYIHPDTVVPFTSEIFRDMDIIIGCMAAAVVLTIAISRHIVVYDRKLAELEKANAALKSLNRMKSEFLQDMSHEMQNPLSVISVGADFVHFSIDREDGAADAHMALNIVQNEAMRLGRMVSGMVGLASMSGDPRSREKLDFSALLRDCAESARMSAEKKNNTLRVVIDDLPYVYAENDRLRQAVANLLDNAVRHTECGEITLAASQTGSYIIVRVSDTGKGISPELLPSVFMRGISGSGGSGFGLPICKTIIEAYGGTVGIKSTPDKGTDVTFTIPIYGGQDEARVYE